MIDGNMAHHTTKAWNIKVGARLLGPLLIIGIMPPNKVNLNHLI